MQKYSSPHSSFLSTFFVCVLFILLSACSSPSSPQGNTGGNAGTHSLSPDASATSSATPTTASTPQGLYVITTKNAPNVFDSLAGPSALNWDALAFSGGGSCGYTAGSYHATMSQTDFFTSCVAENTHYSNVLFQVRMTIQSGSGSDGGGLLFRASGNTGYRLRIGLDGSYDLVTPTQTLVSGTSSAIKTGMGQTNLMAIAAHGSTIDIYVNKMLVATLTNTTFSVGRIGVMGVDFSSVPVNVAFSNAQIWLI